LTAAGLESAVRDGLARPLDYLQLGAILSPPQPPPAFLQGEPAGADEDEDLRPADCERARCRRWRLADAEGPIRTLSSPASLPLNPRGMRLPVKGDELEPGGVGAMGGEEAVELDRLPEASWRRPGWRDR